MDLFQYPQSPGFKAMDTSAAAAIDMEPKAPHWRHRVLHALADTEGLTADEVSLMLNTPVTTIRPRFSELKATGEIIDTGKRRRGISGKQCAVWKVA